MATVMVHQTLAPFQNPNLLQRKSLLIGFRTTGLSVRLTFFFFRFSFANRKESAFVRFLCQYDY